jgi:hypothetical protein
MEGCSMKGDALILTDGGSTNVARSILRWDMNSKIPEDDLRSAQLPVYINGERRSLLATVDVPITAELSKTKLIQRGCCLKTSA